MGHQLSFDPANDVLMPHEAAALWRVDPKTICRWAKAGKIPHFKTPGGHIRFYRRQVDPAFLADKKVDNA